MKRMILVVVASIALSACGSGDKLASVDGRAINKSEFDAYLKFKRVPVQNGGERNMRLLDDYVQRETLAAAIEKAGVLDKELTKVELNEFRKEMLISRYFEKYLEEQVNDNAVQNYYASHEKEYQDNRIHVAHILLRTQKTMSETERKAKLTTAQAAYAQLKKGKEFNEVAGQFSEDGNTNKKDGDLGWLKQGAIDPVFSEKIFALQSGEVSEPFETQFGYHIVKILEGQQVMTRPLDAVKGDIRYQLRNQAKDAEIKRLSEKVSSKKYGS